MACDAQFANRNCSLNIKYYAVVGFCVYERMNTKSGKILNEPASGLDEGLCALAEESEAFGAGKRRGEPKLVDGVELCLF